MAYRKSVTAKGDLGADRASEARSMGTFSGAQSMTKKRAGWKAMTSDTAMDQPYKGLGSDQPGSGIKGTTGSPRVNVNVGSDLAPKKPSAAVFKRYPTTAPPKGNISPVRGEGPTRNVNR